MRREDREHRPDSSKHGNEKEGTREPRRPSPEPVKGGPIPDEPQRRPSPEPHPGRLPIPD